MLSRPQSLRQRLHSEGSATAAEPKEERPGEAESKKKQQRRKPPAAEHLLRLAAEASERSACEAHASTAKTANAYAPQSQEFGGRGAAAAVAAGPELRKPLLAPFDLEKTRL